LLPPPPCVPCCSRCLASVLFQDCSRELHIFLFSDFSCVPSPPVPHEGEEDPPVITIQSPFLHSMRFGCSNRFLLISSNPVAVLPLTLPLGPEALPSGPQFPPLPPYYKAFVSASFPPVRQHSQFNKKLTQFYLPWDPWRGVLFPQPFSNISSSCNPHTIGISTLRCLGPNDPPSSPPFWDPRRQVRASHQIQKALPPEPFWSPSPTHLVRPFSPGPLLAED